MGTIGRLYFYVIAFITLLVVTYGAGSLVSSTVKFFLGADELLPETGYWRRVLSTYLPMLIIGAPLWAVHWLALQRRAFQTPEEQQAFLRKLFLNAVLAVSSLAGLFNAVRFIYHSLAYLTGTSLDPIGLPGKLYEVINAAIWLLVYGSIWYYHREVEKEEGRHTEAARTLSRLYVYLVSLVSINVLGVGIFMNLSLIVSFLTGGLAQQMAGVGAPTLLKRWSLTFAPIIGGGAWWYFHWLYSSRKDTESLLRHVYLYLLIFVGLAVTVGGLGAMLFEVLRFLFGYRAISLSMQIAVLEFALPAFLIGAGTWGYHLNVVREEAPAGIGTISGVRRRYNYLVSFFGLFSLSIGLASLMRVLLEMGFDVGAELNRAPDWWRDQLSVFIVLTALGLAVWVPHWSEMQRLVDEQEDVERLALSRRLVLYLIIFAGVIAILVSGALLLNGLLRLALGEPVTRRFLATIFSNTGNVVVVGSFLFYHWRTLSRDRELTTGTSAAAQKRLTALAAPQLRHRISQLEDALATKITVLDEIAIDGAASDQERESAVLSDHEVEELADKIRSAPGNKIFLLFSKDRVEVRPYR